MSSDRPPPAPNPHEALLLLQQELAETNQEVMLLTLELEKRVDERTTALRVAQEKLQRTNAELLQLTLELEDRVAQRTQELAQANQLLRQEIIERQQAEQALRESHARTRAIVETALDGLITMDHEGRIVEFNPAAEQIFGYRGSEVIGRPLAEVIIPPALRERHQRGLAHYLATGEVSVLGKRIEVVGQRANGSAVPVELSITRMPGVGAPMFIGFLRDITERKQAEQKLQAQIGRLELLNRTTRAIGERQDLRSIFQVVIRSLEDNLPIDFGCILLNDQPNNVLTVACIGIRSEALAFELAMTEQARIPIDQNGLAPCVRGQLVYEPEIADVQAPFPQRLAGAGLHALVAAPLLVEGDVFGVLLAARKQAHGFSSGECEFLRQLSDHVALAAQQARLYSALQQAYDDLRQTQQAVLQQERLRALGQMASGIAHDINNAISPITLYTESLLEREANLSTRARDYLETIQRAIEDVADTVARMREFYRPREQQLPLTEIQLNRTIHQVIDLTRARWSDMPQERGIVVHLQTELAADLPAIMGAESEIRDALTNLVLNAVDAMPEGGVLTLRTRAVSTQTHSDDRASAMYIHLEVCDTGAGMDEETRRRCLEPFFTTKGERGTGLGLAMVYGMTQRHNATLEVESELDKGTTIRLIFPIALPVLSSTVRPSALSLPTQRLRILIMDDDPLLLKSLRDTLEGDGHLVTTADSGQAGVAIFVAARQRGEPFAVVITDLGMPYMDGRQVAAAIKADAPTTPVILLTGWGQHLKDERDAPPHVDRVLSKPPKAPELRAALAELTVNTP